MKIPPFALERYFAVHEFSSKYLLCASDCESFSVRELLALEPSAAEELDRLRLGYTETTGARELRGAIASSYETIAPERVLVHSGAEEAIFTFMNAALAPGDHVIVHAPCYQSLFEVARAIGCAVTPWRADPAHGWAPDLAVLQAELRKNTRLVVVNFPHNPTGFLPARAFFDELVALSQRHGFLLFSDEVYRFLERRDEDRLPALCDIDDRGASLGVMSKSFGLAGLRIGWIATHNADLLAKLTVFKDYTTICSAAPSELLATLALRHRQQLLARNRRLLAANLELAHRFFADHARQFEWFPPVAGPVAFPRLRRGSVAEFCANVLAGSGVLLLPGTLYDGGGDHFRIGLGRADLAMGLRAFASFLEGA